MYIFCFRYPQSISRHQHGLSNSPKKAMLPAALGFLQVKELMTIIHLSIRDLKFFPRVATKENPTQVVKIMSNLRVIGCD